MVIAKIILYLLSFVVIWFGAGLIIGSIDRIAKRLKLSAFAISFFFLGFLTSIPEIAISATAVADGNPEIFVGTLLGGIIVLFLFIIPVLAILGKGIRLTHDLNTTNILITLIVVATPAFMSIDHTITVAEGVILLLNYGILFYLIQKKHGIFEHSSEQVMEMKAYSMMDLVKVVIGIGLVFVSSQFIVNETMIFSEALNIPALYISLVVLSVGTNLPELSIAIRSVISGKKDIAFGDYLGSAAANSFLFGLFTIINNGEVVIANNFLMTFFFTAVGLTLFFFFCRSNRNISKTEGILLLCIYMLFIAYEISKGFA